MLFNYDFTWCSVADVSNHIVIRYMGYVLPINEAGLPHIEVSNNHHFWHFLSVPSLKITRQVFFFYISLRDTWFKYEVQAKLRMSPQPEEGDSRLMSGSTVFTCCFSPSVPVFLQLQRGLSCVALKTTQSYTTDIHSAQSCCHARSPVMMHSGAVS